MEGLFTDRLAVLGTMHGKEQVIAPILERELGLRLVVPAEFNTDTFGTFTRDIPRRGTQVEAARAKAEAVLDQTGETLALASEGTFAPHPFLSAVPCNREIVLLLDRQHNLEIYGEAVSLETNFRHATVTEMSQVLAFAEKVGFPEHGLIVMPGAQTSNPEDILKGITTEGQLRQAVERLLARSTDGRIHIETDMRAHFNPTRMRTIAQATENLVQKLKHTCPDCDWPGFDITERRPGLPCSLCGLPTTLTLAVVYQCQRCQFAETVLFPDRTEQADPMQCAYCNP